jgi:hypothetical protein
MSATNPTTPTVGAQSRVSHGGHTVPQWSAFATLIPQQFRPLGTLPKQGNPPPSRRQAGGGIYVSEFYNSTMWAYPNKNTGNNGPTCSITPVSYINDLATDQVGNLIEPDGGSREVNIFTGPGTCGSLMGTISDGYGQPADAASANAATGKIAVGNIFDNSGEPGSISVCTLSGGCTSNLTNANMYELAGVAMANNGDCWGSAINSGGTATLTYFAGCAGGGVAATGFMNSSYGGLDIDNKGNLVAMDLAGEHIWVYSGCNPACTVVGGPFSAHGESVFGHLNKQSMAYAAGDFANGEVDVYTYNPTDVAYRYSFNNGLSASLDVEGVAYNPASKQ